MRESTRAELTVRGLIIGAVITLVFTAANVYFGLKAGLTFSTSIPAAVISMAILRGFRDATIQENNIVQTVASAAGTLSSIIFGNSVHQPIMIRPGNTKIIDDSVPAAEATVCTILFS